MSSESKQNTPSSGQTATRERLRLISILDIFTVIALIVLIPIAWFVPERLWPIIGRFSVSVAFTLVPGLEQSRARRIVPFLGSIALPCSTHELLVRELSAYFEDTLVLLKCYRPDGWEPWIEVQGLEHLRAAVAGGRGVVMWFSHFVYASLIAKIALHQAGFRMSHLSHPRHGFSSTRFGMRCLNPVRTRVEQRYLRERVVMGMDGTTAAVQTLRERLLSGGIVSITARDIANKPVRVPLLSGHLSLALGAPGLAKQTRTGLLTAHAVRKEGGGYAVIIDPPIDLEDTRPPIAAGEYARRLTPFVCEFPDQWLGWGSMHATPAQD